MGIAKEATRGILIVPQLLGSVGSRCAPNGARLSCGATFEHAQTYDSSNRRRRQLQAQVRPATIEPHDAHTLTLHDHEPRTLPRAPTELSSWVALGLTGRA